MTEAAAAAAIAAILVLVKLVMPFLVAVTMMASAVPIAVIAGLHGMRWGIGTAVAEILLVNMIGGPEIGLTTAFMRQHWDLHWATASSTDCPL